MNKNSVKTETKVKDQKINILRIENQEYISLTDLARYADNEEPRLPIRDWMRNKDVILYLGLWESINNKNFKGGEFATFKNDAGSNKLKCHLKSGLEKQMLLVLYQNLVDMMAILLPTQILPLNLQVG